MAPKFKFNEESKVRPWVIPIGLDFHVISPPSKQTQYLNTACSVAPDLSIRSGKHSRGGLDGWLHLASNQTNTVNNFRTIGLYDRGRGIEEGCLPGSNHCGIGSSGNGCAGHHALVHSTQSRGGRRPPCAETPIEQQHHHATGVRPSRSRGRTKGTMREASERGHEERLATQTAYSEPSRPLFWLSSESVADIPRNKGRRIAARSFRILPRRKSSSTLGIVSLPFYLGGTDASGASDYA